MKKYIGHIVLVAIAAILSSCAKEVLGPEQMISGEYALDDGSQISNIYLNFEKGYVARMSASSKYTIADNNFWGCKTSDFSQDKRSRYSIQDGELYAFGTNMGKIRQEGDVMTINGERYAVLKGFKPEYYSRINLDEQKIDYLAQRKTVEVTIENPINAGVLTASSTTSWISDVKIVNNKTLSYAVSETNIDREGTISLSYTNAAPCDVTLKQEPLTQINLTSSSGEITDSRQSCSISYTIYNPVATSKLNVECNENWVSNIRVGDNMVTFEVDANLSTFGRTASFTIKYAGARDVTYTLVQNGSIVTSLTLDKSALSLTAGSSETLVVTVQPYYAELKWESNHPEYATVDANGKVTAVDAGNATITVSSGGKKATCFVTVSNRENELALTPSWPESTGLAYGNTGTITISNPSEGALSISSQPNSAVAVASLSGNKVIVTPVLPGETSLTVKSAKTVGFSEATKTVSIKVIKGTPTFSVSPTSLVLTQGGSGRRLTITSNSDCQFTVTSGNTSIVTVSGSGALIDVIPGYTVGTTTITVNCPATEKFNEGTPQTINVEVKKDETLVDLGLSVKWRTCNLGASKPEEYGGYYQWAGIQDVTSTSISLDWSNCPYHNGSFYLSGWTKYDYYMDGKLYLESGDDAAHVVLGGRWRIPTKTEWDELKNNCSWTKATINGVNGYKVTSNKQGYTDNYIFLPAAGHRYSNRLAGAGTDGYYWSSFLDRDFEYEAYAFWLDAGGNYDYILTVGTWSRYYGMSIRPVSK